MENGSGGTNIEYSVYKTRELVISDLPGSNWYAEEPVSEVGLYFSVLVFIT